MEFNEIYFDLNSFKLKWSVIDGTDGLNLFKISLARLRIKTKSKIFLVKVHFRELKTLLISSIEKTKIPYPIRYGVKAFGSVSFSR